MTDFNKAQTRVCLLVLGLAALSITLLLSLSPCPSSLSPCIYIPLSARALSSFTLAWTELSRELAAEGESNLEEPFFFSSEPSQSTGSQLCQLAVAQLNWLHAIYWSRLEHLQALLCPWRGAEWSGNSERGKIGGGLMGKRIGEGREGHRLLGCFWIPLEDKERSWWRFFSRLSFM